MIHGADPTTVRAALDGGGPLPGTRGFAGRLDAEDGAPRLVRDVLGRYPCFTEADDHTTWSFDPRDLTDPAPVPAGHVRTQSGDEQVWTLPDPPATDDDAAAIEAVRAAVAASTAAVDAESLAVAFSGGVDSAILAARLDAPLYVAGFPDSHDVDAARSAAAAMDRDLTVVELTHEDIERAVPELVRATGRANAMDVGIALPLYLVAEQVAADGYDRLAVGQGADELFGGYAKVAKAPDDPRVDAETVRGARREVVTTLPDQLERDVLALRAAGVEPVPPLLDDRVVEAALPLPGTLLVADPKPGADRGDAERKVALRRAAEPWLPETVAGRDKKAVQYGSLVSRELDRLARQAGYKRRMDDHVTKYVRSLVE
ncbi:asparagine synthase (glutamine-hydrolysing) [Halorientalis regularis]|jgi:asparagine synthase (glutamine-hydrolysing)|uniref:Asparagine synthase (Glutamine-hydrolysing) n=1 Tax=Halorientalis regularis TaxID=660518 RepID=A0A1G7F786_9EURY|nr:asparagine synthase-related protein [Halorientalis regularis]SDE71696.1 asparagine synthase (glutamine-hydrolysing) [Halorientalis regularis]